MRSELPQRWRRRSLADVCRSITSGGTPARKHEERFYSESGHPWVKTKELVDRIIEHTEEYITEAALAESAAKLLPACTVLMAMYASPTVGRLGVLKREAACNQACAALIVDEDQAHYRFVFYSLLHHRGRLQQIASGSAQQNINARIVKAFELPFPPRDEQERIVAVLGALDDKIDSNRRLATLLEETLATVFRARFVDFLGIEEFEESEIGRVPRGWRPGSLTELAAFVNGKAFTKEANGQGCPILRIKELKAGVSDATPWSDVDAPEEHVARHHDILFAWSGSLDVYRWSGPDALINQHIFKVIPRGYPAWFAFEWIRQHMPEFQAIARDKATTMGHIQRRHLSEATVLIPNGDAIAKARATSDPLDTQHSAVAAEIQTLTALRDALLPKLVSGEIRVPDTADPDEAIGAAAARVAA